jgi:hypothetical protein
MGGFVPKGGGSLYSSHFGLAFLRIAPADIPSFDVSKTDPLRWIALVATSRMRYEQLLSKAAV